MDAIKTAIDAFQLTPDEKTILEAAQAGNFEKVQEMYYKNQELQDARTPYGKSPMHIAAEKGYLEIVQFFLDQGFYVNNLEKCKIPFLEFYFRRSPMRLAAKAGKRNIVEFLLKRGGEMDPVKAIFEASQDNDIRRIKAVLKGNPELLTVADSTGKMPLHIAAKNGYLEIVKLIIKEGVDVNLTERDPNPIVRKYFGRTPLEYAVTEGHSDVVIALVGAGANVDIRHTTGKTPLHMAAINADLKLMELLIAKGADINSRDVDGKTALHLMIFDGQEKEALMLINRKANLDAQDETGATPLHLAIQEDRHELAKTLLHKGASVRKYDKMGCTPLFMVTEETPIEVVELMVKKGLEINHNNNDGFTALQTIQNQQVLEYLRRHGGRDI